MTDHSEKTWRESAKNKQIFFYNEFRNHRFQAYDPHHDRSLLRAKINFSLFGPGMNEVDNIEEAYTEEQNSAAEGIIDIIYRAYYKQSGGELSLSIIFIICYERGELFQQPIYALFCNETTKFIDTMGRTYCDWENFKWTNKFPEMEYCLPLNGRYSCSYDKFEYDPDKEPLLEFCSSPYGTKIFRGLRKADKAAGLLGLGAGVLTLAALVTPVGLGIGALAAAASIGGTGAAVYGGLRSVYEIIDKAIHNEKMANLECFLLYGSVVSLPLNILSSMTSSALARQAVRGSIGRKALRRAATIMSVSVFGYDSTYLLINIANLAEKKKNNTLNSMDIIHFSMSTFFFTHTLMQPKTANGILLKAQNEHLMTISETFSEDDAIKALQTFIKNNSGDIREKSHVIRTLNRMNDPEAFFHMYGESLIKLGGRKGKTVMVDDCRVNANS